MGDFDRHRGPAAGRPAAAPLGCAQDWRDERIVVEALRARPDEDVLSVASAGDTTLALALAGARSVVAVDVSEAQRALVELKLAGASLHYLEFRQLLGLDAPGRRVFLYHQVRPALSDASRRYWDAHESVIREGILGSGRVERYLAAFRERALPLVHGPAAIAGWFSLPDIAAQRAYYAEVWDTWRWRAMFRTFFSRRVMAARGRGPEPLARADEPVAAALLGRVRRALTELPLRDNGYVQWLLLGERIADEALPAYLSPLGFARLADVADRVRLERGPIQAVLGRERGRFSAFDLHDLSGLPLEAEGALREALLAGATPGARVARWGLSGPLRPLAGRDRIEAREAEAEALRRRDRGFVYGSFDLEVVR